MYVKLASNELMLRSDGTVAPVDVDVGVLPPQAIATIPTIPSVGTSLANLIWFFLLSKWHLSPSSRRAGARVRRRTGLTQNPWRERSPAESIAHPPKFVKSAMVRTTQFVQTLDKPRRGAMIRIRAMPKKGEGSLA